MTEYMNMANISYAVEFPKRSIDEIVKLVNTIPEPQPVPLKYVIPLLSYAMKLQAENAHLKDQLRWRPVSEKPEKDGDYFAKSDTSNEPFVLSYKDGIWFFYDYDIGEKVMTSPPYLWLPIPLAPEEKNE